MPTRHLRRKSVPASELRHQNDLLTTVSIPPPPPLLLQHCCYVLRHSYCKNPKRSLTPMLRCSYTCLTCGGGVFSARCNIYISRLCHDASPSVRLSVTEVHWRIIASLGFKFRSHFTAHCGRRAAGGRRAARRAACGQIISRHASQC